MTHNVDSFDDFTQNPFSGALSTTKTDQTEDDATTVTFDKYSLSGKKKKKQKDEPVEPKNLGEELETQLLVKEVRTLGTQTDWKWKKMAQRWKNAKVMYATFLDENDFFEPDPERVQAANTLLREIAHQIPDLFNVLTYDELQDLSDVLSNVGLKRTDAKTNLLDLLTSVPYVTEIFKRLSTSTVASTPFRRDSLASSTVGRKLMDKLPDIFEEYGQNEEPPQRGMESRASTATTMSTIIATIKERSAKSKGGKGLMKGINADISDKEIAVPGEDGVITATTTAAADNASAASTATTPESGSNKRWSRSTPETSHRASHSHSPHKRMSVLKKTSEEELSEIMSTSDRMDNMILSKLMETDYKVEFFEGTSTGSSSSQKRSRGSSIFSEHTTALFAQTSFEKHIYKKKQEENRIKEEHDDDPSLYLFGRSNKCVDTHDLNFDPYDLRRFW